MYKGAIKTITEKSNDEDLEKSNHFEEVKEENIEPLAIIVPKKKQIKNKSSKKNFIQKVKNDLIKIIKKANKTIKRSNSIKYLTDSGSTLVKFL